MSKRPRRPGELRTLADILPQVARNLELEKKVNELALLSLWHSQAAAIGGPEAAAKTRALKIRKQGNQRILLVRVAHAALASELSFHLLAIRDAINGFAPQTGLTVDRIQLSVGAVAKSS